MTIVKQVGGSHYAATAPNGQHWDYVEAYDVAYLEGNATAYIRRYPIKGVPIQDLEKAISFLLKMDGRPARRRLPENVFEEYATANALNPDQKLLTWYVIGELAGTPETIIMAIDHMRALVKHIKTTGRLPGDGR